MPSFKPPYAHRLGAGVSPLPPGKAVCVGRNYADHAAELDNPLPEEPLLFIKPATAMAAFAGQLRLAARLGSHHYETEMTLLIGRRLYCCGAEEGVAAIAGIGVGLDLTLRDTQNRLKAQGHPWERAKAFDGSCVLSPFVPPPPGTDLHSLSLRLWRNGVLVQNGNTGEMLYPVARLLQDISRVFTLTPGDVVMTGTPKGVGQLHPDDKLVAELGTLVTAEATVIFENV